MDRERSMMLNPERPGVVYGGLGSLTWLGRLRRFRWKKGDPVPEPVDDEDPGDERGLRDVLRDDAKP